MKFSFLLLAVTWFFASSVYSQNLPRIEDGVSHELGSWHAEHYSDVRYKLDLLIEKKAPTLKGSIEIGLKFNETGRIPTVMESAKTSESINADSPSAPL